MMTIANSIICLLFIIPHSLLLSILILALIILSFLFFVVLKRQKKMAQELKEISSKNMGLQNEVEEKSNKIAELLKLVKTKGYELLTKDSKLKEIEERTDRNVLVRTNELHSMLEKSDESNKLKDAFLEKISHEIRTPLNAILGFINLLNNPNLPKRDQAYYYKYIHNSGNNLLGLIDNIIDFSKLETNELLLSPKRCQIHIFLSDVVEKYRARLIKENKNLTIILNKDAQNIESLIDCKRVITIIDQLLSNAIKFTTEGHVEVFYEIKDNFHHFKVSDTGIGIYRKYQDIIFERFYQIIASNQEIYQGAGLGLTIAKRLVDLLGGQIKMSSKKGKGSVFEFTIPFIGIDELKTKSKNIEENYNWKDKCILIAEDEDSNYYFLEALLKKTKAKLIRVVDGIKFLEIMNGNHNIDLVLLDIKMPGINGLNAIKVIRQQNIAIPVIAQTAFNQSEDKQRCLDNGCNDYISKPIDKDVLFNKISKFLTLS